MFANTMLPPPVPPRPPLPYATPQERARYQMQRYLYEQALIEHDKQNLWGLLSILVPTLCFVGWMIFYAITH